MQERLIVDMDDVMADASGSILEIYNEEFGTHYTHGDFDNTNLWDQEVSHKYLSVRHRLFEPGFFRNMAVKDNAVEIMKHLNDKYEVFIVSAATEFPNSLKEKIEWLEEHFTFISWKRVVLCGDKKVIKGDIMLDDHDKNLKTFQGRPILFDAIHNRNLQGYERVKNWDDVAALLL